MGESSRWGGWPLTMIACTRAHNRPQSLRMQPEASRRGARPRVAMVSGLRSGPECLLRGYESGRAKFRIR